MEFFDFKFLSLFEHYRTACEFILEAVREHGPNRFRSTLGVHSQLPVSTLRRRYQGNRYVKDFSCWDQFLCLAFAQLTYRTSLRDIEACLRAQQPRLYISAHK